MAVTGFAVFAPGLRSRHYADDFIFVFEGSDSSPISYFLKPPPGDPFYRPFATSFLSLAQSRFGLETSPIHATKLFLHVLLSYLVFGTGIRIGLNAVQAGVGSLYMLLSQTNVHAVASVDTLSQVGGTLFGWVSLSLCYLSRDPANGSGPGDPNRRRAFAYWASVATLGLSLGFKESSVAFLPMLLWVLVLPSGSPSRAPKLSAAALRSLPFVALTLFYLGVRAQMMILQPKLGTERYDFRIGFNVIENSAKLLFSCVLPVSSVDTVRLIEHRRLWALIPIVAASLLLPVIAWWGARRSGANRGALRLLAGMAVLALFPVVFLNHVSELHSYSLMPFASLLLGAGLGAHWTHGAPGPRRAAAIAVLLCLLASHVWAIQTKMLQMRRNGDRAASLLDQIKPYAALVPPGGRLLLVNPPGREIEYSVFMMPGFKVLSAGLHRIHALTGRSDFETEILDAAEFEREPRQEESLALTLRDGSVITAGADAR